MMPRPNRLGRMTSAVADAVASRRSSSVGRRPSRCCSSPKRRRQFSMMMTAPSTIRPKSSAPRLIRLPDTPPRTMPVRVNSIDSGITAAVISAARTLPSSRNSTTTTRIAPSTRFLATVRMVRSTSEVRSYIGSARTPAGRLRLASANRAATACETSRLLAPISMKVVPSTTSLPSSVAAPVRSSGPSPTCATSRTRIGTPSRRSSTMSRMPSRSATCPGARTRNCWPLRSM